MHAKDTIPIAFSVGCYGTYLEWVLTTLSVDQHIAPPFTDTGSSHLFFGNHVENNAGWLRYLQGDQRHRFVRFHPKEKKNQSLSANLNQVLDSVDRMIYIYPDADSVLLVINNWLSKVRKDWWAHYIVSAQNLEKIHANWPCCAGQSADDIPVWVRREFLSFYLIPAWQDQIEWYHPDAWHDGRCAIITVSELLYDFESCLSKLQQFANLSYKKSIDEILPYHEIMLELQQHRTQDQLCKNIVETTINDSMFDWSGQEIPLPSQSWIQWQLRNSGWELACDGLDTWPTNSVQLKQLLYLADQ
jgi:hypothetical protein